MGNLLKSFVRHGKVVAWLLDSWVKVVRKTWFSPVVRWRVICALRRSKPDLDAVSLDLTDTGVNEVRARVSRTNHFALDPSLA